jgi:succinate dehydrogenase / fumarate reductase cytochrome b subunit
MAASKAPDSRPLSPHVQVWRWHLTMAASIAHRVSGMALYFGSFLIALWLAALAFSPELHSGLQVFMSSWFGRAILFLWVAGVLYHLANGVRHLIWDGPGSGFDPKAASNASAFNFAFAFAGALIITYFSLRGAA